MFDVVLPDFDVVMGTKVLTHLSEETSSALPGLSEKRSAGSKEVSLKVELEQGDSCWRETYRGQRTVKKKKIL